MSANARVTKKLPALPTLDDVDSGKVTLDEYEIAHREDIPEWTDADFSRARPMREMFPEIVEAFEKKRGQRGPQKAPIKERVGLRLDHEIVAHFRATGPGWQGRINEVLAKHVKSAGR
ncbi:MAG: BrnA antitoxin family protein [Hyphomicrobiales bacterium]|nr:BrnA antitoxin family protein [Hyphomicrobiales bacterium]